MRRDRRLLLLALCLGPAACAPPDPRPGPIRAMAPRPNPPTPRAVTARPAPGKAADLPQRLRRAPWLARFWSELSPGQRRRVAARMPGPTPADGAATAQRWDVMGLQDRAALVFGDGAAPAPPPALATEGPPEGSAGG